MMAMLAQSLLRTGLTSRLAGLTITTSSSSRRSHGTFTNSSSTDPTRSTPDLAKSIIWEKEPRLLHLENPRLSALSANAAFLSGRPLLGGDDGMLLPGFAKSTVVISDPGSVQVAKKEPTTAVAVEEPNKNDIVEKIDPKSSLVERYEARNRRLLILRKFKMKKHRRKRREKRQAARIKKQLFAKAKSEETAFRASLMHRIRLAKQFDPEAYRAEYLADVEAKMVPQTYEGRRHPTWLVEQLTEEEQLRKRRRREEQLDLITREPLVKEGETVEEFIKRIEQRDRDRC